MPAQTLESPDEHPVASAGRAMVGVRVDPPGRGVDRVGVLARSEMRQAWLAGPLFADQVRRMEAGGVVHHGPAAEAAALEDEYSVAFLGELPARVRPLVGRRGVVVRQ